GLTDVVEVVGSQFASYALRTDGTVWSWGYSHYGALGTGALQFSNVPIPISGLTGVATLGTASTNVEFGRAVKADGTVWTWGASVFGRLGDGTSLDSPVPVQVP